MKSLGTRNSGVDFLLENMQSNQFAQTLLGFNTTIRMKLDKETQMLTVSYECEQFSNWTDVLKKCEHSMESCLKDKFGDKFNGVSDDGFDLQIPCPDGITEETQTLVSSLRHLVYVAVFTEVAAKAPQQPERGWKFTDGLVVKINKKCQAYFSITKEKSMSVYWQWQEPASAMEKELLNVFKSEFATARKQRHLGSAPPVSYNSKTGTLNLIFSPNHLKKMDTVCHCIYSVPDDIDYHLKCSKTYFHHKMHTQVDDWLKTLNRADPTKKEGNNKKRGARKALGK